MFEDDDKLNFLGETAEDNPERTPGGEQPAKTAEELAAETEAAEAAKVEVPEKVEEKPAGSEEVVTDKDGKTVPLATFLDVLHENKDLKKLVKGAKETPSTEDAPQFEVPDPVKNPREYAAYQDTMSRLNILNERMNVSERFARKEHGSELIDKVRDWALERMDKDEAFGNKVVNDADPYSVAVAAYNEHIELEPFRAWVAGGKKPEDAPWAKQADRKPALKKLETPIVVKAAAGGTPKPAEKVPTSIVDQPSGGGAGVIPAGDGVAFGSLFKD